MMALPQAAEYTALKQTFLAVSAAPMADRDFVLRQQCEGKPALLGWVKELLDQCAETEPLVDEPIVFDISDSRLQPGDLLCDRFRIQRRLGAGGMGEVYSALDSRLNRDPVALKLIRLDLAQRHGFREALRAEVIAARSVSHANVCRVYDLFVHSGFPGPDRELIAMELIDGPCLDRRFDEGRLSKREVLDLSRQLMDGVEAIHRAGLVHLDLKPANILISRFPDGSTRYVISDFGLTKPLEQAGWSRHRNPLDGGTHNYQAPERRDNGRPPAATRQDLYSIGVILFRAWTGVLPPEDLTARGSLWRSVPMLWRGALRKCLAPEPERRIRTIAELHRRVSEIPRRTAIAGLAAMIPGAYFLPKALTPSPGHRTVLFGDVANFTGDSTYDNFGPMLTHMARQSPDLSALGPEAIAETLKQMMKPEGSRLDSTLANEVAIRMGVPIVVSGEWQRDGAAVRLRLRLQEMGSAPDQPKKEHSQVFQASVGANLFSLIEQCWSWLQTAAGGSEPLAPEYRRPIEATTPSWSAWSLYQQAEALRVSHGEQAAMEKLREAVALDADFPLALMRLGDLLVGGRQYAEGHRFWDEALSALDRRKVSLHEDLRIRAQYAEEMGDHAEMLKRFDDWIQRYPNDYQPWQLRLSAFWALGRFDEAAQSVDKAEALARMTNQYRFAIPVWAAFTAVARSDWRRLREENSKLRELHQPAWADCMDGIGFAVQGDAQKAIDRFHAARSQWDIEWRGQADLFLARVRAEMGDRDGCARCLMQDLDRSDEAPWSRVQKLISLASVHVEAGDAREGLRLARNAIDLDGGVPWLMRVSVLHVQAGDVGEARRLLNRIDADRTGSLFRYARARIQGELHFVQGNAQAALQEFSLAHSLQRYANTEEPVGRALAALRRYREAAAVYERVVAARPIFWRIAQPEPPAAWKVAVARRDELRRITTSL